MLRIPAGHTPCSLLLSALLATACGDDADGGATTGGNGGSTGGAASGGTGGTGGAASGGGAPEGGSGGAGVVPLAETFYQYLSGRFDSSAQAAANPAYFAVQLEACPIDAPTLGDRVLYIEQALVSNLGAPYRQRLYVIEAGANPDTDVVSRVYELLQPANFIGQCSTGALTTVSESEAIERLGCEVFATYDGVAFVGGTQGTGCESSLQGASYATSEVSVEADLIASWDRGYDASDMQVWGATLGPYEFVRKD